MDSNNALGGRARKNSAAQPLLSVVADTADDGKSGREFGGRSTQPGSTVLPRESTEDGLDDADHSDPAGFRRRLSADDSAAEEDDLIEQEAQEEGEEEEEEEEADVERGLLNESHSVASGERGNEPLGVVDGQSVEDEDDADDMGPAAPTKSIRLQSLDVFRGITIAWMIFVDNVGASWPEVDHSPWDGASPADFVMPNFDFIVGVAAVFSLSRFTSPSASGGDRCAATKKIIVRFVKLFLLGIATQCGVSLFVYNLSQLRIMGILQRVACCYLVAALAEVWCCGPACLPLPTKTSGLKGFLADHFAVVRHYASQFVLGSILVTLNLAILYGVDVPDFQDGVQPGVNISCGRGKLTPACNAAAYVDRLVFGVNHMYFPANGGGDGRGVTFQRLPQCSSCSPGACGNFTAGLWPVNSTAPPAWCCTIDGDVGACPDHASFDPEGLTSTFTCVVASLIGLHFGHIYKFYKPVLAVARHGQRRPMMLQVCLQWFVLSVVLVAVGGAIHLTHDCTSTPGLCTGGLNMPWNTDLYSFPFLLFTTGVSGLILCGCFVVIDVAPHPLRRTLQPFRWLGLNAITIYILAEGGVPDWVCSWFYLSTPEQNLQNIFWPTGVYWGEDEDDWMNRVDFTRESHSIAILFWCVGYIGVWTIVAAVMHFRQCYIKI